MGIGDERRRARSPVSVTELRKQYGTNLPPSLRWGRDQNTRWESPRRRRMSRSPSPSFLPPPRPQYPPPPPPPKDLLVYRVHVDNILVDSLTYFDLFWEYDKVRQSLLLLRVPHERLTHYSRMTLTT
jgi:hypothetical protein